MSQAVETPHAASLRFRVLRDILNESSRRLRAQLELHCDCHWRASSRRFRILGRCKRTQPQAAGMRTPQDETVRSADTATAFPLAHMAEGNQSLYGCCGLRWFGNARDPRRLVPRASTTPTTLAG